MLPWGAPAEGGSFIQDSSSLESPKNLSGPVVQVLADGSYISVPLGPNCEVWLRFRMSPHSTSPSGSSSDGSSPKARSGSGVMGVHVLATGLYIAPDREPFWS